jgi:hypothetical protein
LVDATIPAGDAKDLASSLVAGQNPSDVDEQVYGPADDLAELGEAAGEVADGQNKFEWVVDALGWAADHPAASVGGTFATIGTTAAMALGATGPAVGVVGVVAGLGAATLAYFGSRRRNHQPNGASG